MSNFFFRGSLVLLFTIAVTALFSQVWYKLSLMEDGETYQISLISEVDWTLPNNITSTGQVTIKTPTLEFEIADFESVHSDLTWKYNSRMNAPTESSDFDYLSFGLETANRAFEYEAQEEIPIIRFRNAKGCAGFVSLINNKTDPVIFSKTKAVNVGNQLTVVGARGNAYVGNKGDQLVTCKRQIKARNQFMKNFILFPNPAFNELNLNLDWTSTAQTGHFFIRNSAGKAVAEKIQKLNKGFNEINFDIAILNGGIYHIELNNANGENIPLDRFVKVYSASIDNLSTDKKTDNEKDN